MGDSCQQCTHLRTQLKDSESIIAQVLSEVTTKTNIIDKLVLENEQLKHNVQELNLRLKSVIDDKMKISVSLDNKKDEQANILAQNVFTAFHTEVDFANQRILDSIFSDEKTFDDSLLKEVRSARKLYSGKSTTREKQIESLPMCHG
ncbi:hypothetical protein DPMN_104314 [Dreissena polymorpha]|uniref:Uncharacterized protein n=1 Tax=Dreissena polymorpha TaxID=45954 RepID=A0A9D4H9J1_DREPO|nr:hypothetical protein DPMN_104314 [Dreissena polymorpha]